MKEKPSPLRHLDRPIALVVLVAVGTGVLVIGIRIFSREPIPSESTKEIVDYSLREQRSGIAQVRGTKVPRIEYVVELPSTIQPRDLRAAIQGTGNSRLPLFLSDAGPNQATFSLLGYSQTVDSPRLVVGYGKIKVLDHPVAPLPTPIRSIPLVVPIENVTLRRVRRDELSRLMAPRRTASSTYGGHPSRMPPGTVFRIDTLSPDDRFAEVQMALTEWGKPSSFTARANDRQPLIWASDPKQGAIAELRFLKSQLHEESVTCDLDIELYPADGQPAVRVLRPVRHRFSDGAELGIPVQDRLPTARERPRLLRNIGIRIEQVRRPPMHPLALDAIRIPDSDGPSMAPAAFGVESHSTTGSAGLTIDLLSKLEPLGLRQLSLGPFEHRAEASPTNDIQYGKHRLKIRLRHWVDTTSVERRYVRIEPPLENAPEEEAVASPVAIRMNRTRGW